MHFKDNKSNFEIRRTLKSYEWVKIHWCM